MAILYHGRDLHLVTEAQRKALIAATEAAASWALVRRRGSATPTDITNLTLLCRRHRPLHWGDWPMTMINGIPHGIAPAWLDPSQAPRCNTAHDPP